MKIGALLRRMKRRRRVCSNQADEMLHEGITVVTEGTVYVVVAVGATVKLVRVIAPLL